jgi:hypothetical protein
MIPYREGCRPGDLQSLTACDAHGLVSYGLGQASCQPGGVSRLDSFGQRVFKGYIRYGRLYDSLGRPARLRLGEDVRQGDVLLFATIRHCAVIADDQPRAGMNYGGLPCRLPVLHARHGFARIEPLFQALFSLRTLFRRSELEIRRYPRYSPPRRAKR